MGTQFLYGHWYEVQKFALMQYSSDEILSNQRIFRTVNACRLLMKNKRSGRRSLHNVCFINSTQYQWLYENWIFRSYLMNKHIFCAFLLQNLCWVVEFIILNVSGSKEYATYVSGQASYRSNTKTKTSRKILSFSYGQKRLVR